MSNRYTRIRVLLQFPNSEGPDIGWSNIGVDFFDVETATLRELLGRKSEGLPAPKSVSGNTGGPADICLLPHLSLADFDFVRE